MCMPDEKTSRFVAEGTKIVDEAQQQNIMLRLMGAIAFRIHCSKFIGLLDSMGRPVTDLDFAGHGKKRMDMIKFFQGRGYVLDKGMLVLTDRLKFHGADGLDIDVFLDELQMCHTIDLRKRLQHDNPTIPLADLLLEKMQIVKINEKDLKDSIVLLREHPVGDGEVETINAAYIADLLSKDWGFYYTVTTNLKKILEFLPKYNALSSEDVGEISSRINSLLEQIESKPKSQKWKFRGKVGAKSKWYKDVEDSPANSGIN
jgi:hypothetical protein